MSDNKWIRLSIAEIPVRIECNAYWIIQQLHLRYKNFSSNLSEKMIVSIEWKYPDVAEKHTNLREFFINQNQIRINQPGYDGFIDTHGHKAILRFSSKTPEEDIDYFLRLVYSLLIFQAGGLLFHGAGIIHDSKAYVFFGPSGSGKSTVAKVSRNDQILNDDLVALMPKFDDWNVFPTPFWIPHGIEAANAPVKLAGFYRLIQDDQINIQVLSTARALAEMLSCIPVLTMDECLYPELSSRCKRIINLIKIFELHFLPDESFWNLIE